MGQVIKALAGLFLLLLINPVNAQQQKSAIQSQIAASSAAGLAGGTILNNMVNSYVDWLTCTGTGGMVYWNAGVPTCLNVSTNGKVLSLISGLPTWVNVNGLSGTALTAANDTNVTLTLGGSPTNALLNATSITAGWTGTLSVARGGTGAATQASAAINILPTPIQNGDILWWNNVAGQWQTLPGNNSGTQFLTEGPTGIPAYVSISSSRIVLSGLTNFYVATTGSDTVGCGTAIGSPCLTPDFLWSQIQTKYDLACSSIKINFAHGTYTSGFSGNGDLFGNCRVNNVALVGDNASPTSVLIQPSANKFAFEAQNGARYFFEGFKIDGRNSAGFDPVTATVGSSIGIGDQSGSGTNIFSCVAGGAAHINPSVDSFVIVTAGYTIDLTGCPANPASHVQMDQQGIMQYSAITIVIVGSQTYTDSFMRSNKGYLIACNLNFTSAFTGPPFSISDGGNITTCASGPGSAVTSPGYFPGSIATVSMTLTAGSTAATVSAPDAATLRTLIGSNIGLYCVSSTDGFTIYNQIPQASSISGTTITLAWPAQTSGAKTVTCGGFVQGAGHYYGSSGNASIPPQP